MGEFFLTFGKGWRGFPKNNIGGRKLWGDFSNKFGEGLRWISKKTILAGGNYGGTFLTNLERVCGGFPKSNIGGRKLWGMCGFPKSHVGGRKLWVWGKIILDIWKRLAWISNKRYWWEEIMGIFREIGRGFAWISQKQYWRGVIFF